MSESASWSKKDQVYTDGAMTTIRWCVDAMRGRGITVDNIFIDLAYRLKISPRRVRTLFRKDVIPVVRQAEWEKLRHRAGCFFLEEAARLRELAKTYDTVGTKMNSDGDISELMEIRIRAETAPYNSMDI